MVVLLLTGLSGDVDATGRSGAHGSLDCTEMGHRDPTVDGQFSIPMILVEKATNVAEQFIVVS